MDYRYVQAACNPSGQRRPAQLPQSQPPLRPVGRPIMPLRPVQLQMTASLLTQRQLAAHMPPPAPSAAASGDPASAFSQPALSEPAAAPASTPASADQAQSSGRKDGRKAPSGQADSAQASLSRPSPAPAQGAGSEQPRQPSQQSGHTSSGDKGPMLMHSQNGQLQVQPSV